MTEKIDKIAREYQERIVQYDTQKEAEVELRRAARKAGDPDNELAIRSAEIRRLNDLQQLCVQIMRDLQSL